MLNRQPLSSRKCCRLLCLGALLTQLSACGYIDYSTHRENFMNDGTGPEDRTLGNIYLNLSQSETAKPYAIDFTRVKKTNTGYGGSNKGFAFFAPMYSAKDNKSKLHYTVSKTKEYKWFSGLQFRWEF